LFSASWKDFESRIGHTLQSLQRRKELLASNASLLEFQAAQEERAAVEKQFEEMERQEEKRRRIAVAAWLDGAKSRLDQHDAKAEREAYPQSGRWLLDRSQVKAWLDCDSAAKPLLWIRGIPGAGKTPRLYLRAVTPLLRRVKLLVSLKS
jgi:hypothetical protein